jgi:hypothetical protein
LPTIDAKLAQLRDYVGQFRTTPKGVLMSGERPATETEAVAVEEALLLIEELSPAVGKPPPDASGVAP